MDIQHHKRACRQFAKAQRAKAQNPAAAYELIRQFPAPEFRHNSFGGIWPLSDEIDLRPLLSALHEMGALLALPCTPPAGHSLIFRTWQPGELLKPGLFGTSEPYSHKPEMRPNFIFVPLLAYNDKGKRLGYGGGFYDRTLERLRIYGDVFACGVAYSAQKLDAIPTCDQDERLDAILTPEGFYRFNL